MASYWAYTLLFSAGVFVLYGVMALWRSYQLDRIQREDRERRRG